MIYHVRFTDGSTQDFEDWTPDTTITQVKEAIKTFKLVSHIDLIRLIFGGRILKNPDTLQNLELKAVAPFIVLFERSHWKAPSLHWSQLVVRRESLGEWMLTEEMR